MNYEPKDDLIEFFKILDREEESDNGILFRPTVIHSCRIMDSIKLEEILKRLKDFSKS